MRVCCNVFPIRYEQAHAHNNLVLEENQLNLAASEA